MLNANKKNIIILLFTLSLVSCTSIQKKAEKPISTISRSILLERAWSEGWNIKKLDTARNCIYLTDAEKDVFLVTNMVRTDPEKFANIYIKEIISYYTGRYLNYPGEIRILTKEGLIPAKELYEQLITQKPLSIIFPSRGLSLAARDHAFDQSRTGLLGHIGSDGSDINIRIERYGNWDKPINEALASGKQRNIALDTSDINLKIKRYKKMDVAIGENIDYGGNTGLRIINDLLIDDDFVSRGHRINILNDKFKFMGVNIQAHPVYRYVAVIDYASEYIEKKH